MKNWTVQRAIADNSDRVCVTREDGRVEEYATFRLAVDAASKAQAQLVFAPIAPLPAAPFVVTVVDEKHEAEKKRRFELARTRWFTCKDCGGPLRWACGKVYEPGAAVFPHFECSKCGCRGPRHEVARTHARKRSPVVVAPVVTETAQTVAESAAAVSMPIEVASPESQPEPEPQVEAEPEPEPEPEIDATPVSPDEDLADGEPESEIKTSGWRRDE